MENLEAFFSPSRVAVIGATEKAGSVGRAVVENLRGFHGAVHLVNRKHPEVLGIKTLARVSDLPAGTDLAVIVTPAPAVPEILRECAAAGIPAAVVISAGFKEAGAAGRELEREVLEIARAASMRVIGPNCLGVMVPGTGLNATFAAAMAMPGNIAFLSQSGALCTAILDWSFSAGMGFSAFVSTGSMLDAGWADLIAHFADDPRTAVIVLYMESVDDAPAFLGSARRAALKKPLVVLKAGRTEAAARAAASHTGALTGSDSVFDAAFARAGVLRVDSIAELFQTAEVLACRRPPRGRRLAIVTNAGGPGALAVDMLARHGGAPADLGAETLARLDAFLPGPWSHSNPADILGDADAARYARALEIVAEDAGNDALLVILTPQAMTDNAAVAEAVVEVAEKSGKPLLASWMGGDGVEAGRRILARAGIPCFNYPDTAARVFARVTAHLSQPPVSGTCAVDERAPDLALRVIARAEAGGRVLLNEAESKQLLGAFGIPVVRTLSADSEDQAVDHARALGFPVVLKLCSRTLTHKTDAGGVRLALTGEDAVRDAWCEIRDAVTVRAGAEHFGGVTVQRMIADKGVELILGASRDAQFGPVALFGAGGVMVHVLQDTALDLAPLDVDQALRLIARTRVQRALLGARGSAPLDMDALARLVALFSRIPLALPQIAEMEINPLLAAQDGFTALDARIVLRRNL